MKKVAIIGSAGVVGAAMRKFFGPSAVTYDIRDRYNDDRIIVNKCGLAVICVPTPSLDDGGCNVSIVAEVVSWLKTPLIVIRSTVSLGTTDWLRKKTGKRIVFQPEYLGETPAHELCNIAEREYVVLGGDPEDTSAVADIYKRFYNAMVRYYFCDAMTAELAKYMENAFYSTKVTFVNEFYGIAQSCGVDYNRLREIWLSDTRISRDHTDVYPDARGFSGKCLPKDLAAIIKASKSNGYIPRLMECVQRTNDAMLSMDGGQGE